MTWKTALIGSGLFLAGLGVSLAVTTVVLVRLPADYFTRTRRPPYAGSHPVVRVLLVAAKNLAGIALIALGIVLSIPGVPGQGLLTIFLGLLLVDLPGKYRLERAIMARPRMLAFVNRLRARFARPPMERP